jgi:hypothetical protein
MGLTSIDKENRRKESSDLGSISKSRTEGTNRSEELDEAQGLHNDDDPESEESSGIHLQSRHEVQD